MSVFDTPYQDAMSVDPSQAAQGPRVGFLESFANSWEQQNRNASAYGLENSFRDAEYAQADALHKAGAEDIPAIQPQTVGAATGRYMDDPVTGTPDLFTMDKYHDVAHFLTNGGTPEDAAQLDKYDARIAELSKRFPDLKLKNSRDLFNDVVQKSQLAEAAANQRTGVAGAIGGFAGGMAVQFNPITNPIGVATLPIGGLGKTALGRIATQAVGQGAIQGINEMTGVTDNRQMLGLDDGIAGSVGRVAGAAIGGAVAQGLGEGLHLAGKRWFRDVPSDPAPAPPVEPAKPLLLTYQPQQVVPGKEPLAPWEQDWQDHRDGIVRDLLNGTKTINDVLYPGGDTTGSRMGKARSILDTDYVASQLEPFDGKDPWEIPPPTSTALPKRVDPDVSPDFNVDIHQPGGNIDDIARQVDPKTFTMFDELAKQKSFYKDTLDSVLKLRSVEGSDAARTAIEEVSNKIELLKQEIDTGRSKGRTLNADKRQARMAQVQELTANRQDLVDKLGGKYTPEMNGVLQKLQDADYKMRDLAPMVTRAYSFAKNQWEASAGDREAVASMIRDGRTNFPSEAPIINDTYENTLARFNQTLTDKTPVLQDAPKVEAKMKPNADAADYATAIIKEQNKPVDEALDSFRNSLDKIVSDEDEKELTLNGQTYKFSLDKDTVHVPNEDGEGSRKITIRQLLEEQAQTEEELKAVQTCSIP